MPVEKKYLKDYQPGEVFIGFFVIRTKSIKFKKNGEPFLVLEIGDKSGRLSGNLWDDADRYNEHYQIGDIIKVKGLISEYNNQPQVNFQEHRLANSEDHYDISDFIPVSKIDFDQTKAFLFETIHSMHNPYLRQLLGLFFEDEKFFQAFSTAPAGKLWHHNRIGGLLEHTAALLRLILHFAELYPEADRDVLITGTLLHDMGKIEEYSYKTHIDYTDRGRLVGHIVLAAQWVHERAKLIPNFPADILDQVTHLILSHQGEHDTPVQPATREAFLLHFADLIDSKMDALSRIQSTKSPFEKWVWVNLLNRYIMLDDDNSNSEEAYTG